MKAWAMVGINNNLPPSERFKHENIMLLGIWFCDVKPNSEYMFELLVNDLNDAAEEFTVVDCDENEIACRVRTLFITLDLEALWMAKYMVPNGEYDCGDCPQQRQTIKNDKTGGHSAWFPPLNDPKNQQPGEPGTKHAHPHPKYRTRQDWVDACNKVRDDKLPHYFGIKGFCVLMNLRHLRWPEAVIPDNMHFLYLHLVPEFRSMWFGDACKGKKFSIAEKYGAVQQDLQHIGIPQERHTAAADLADPNKFHKAAENRLWALYVSCPVLMGKLSEKHFSHWSVFVSVIRYLSGCGILRAANEDRLCLNQCDDLLKLWMEAVPSLYRNKALTHAVHLVLHLCRYVRLFGPLWAINCFAVETFNAYIHRNLHGRKGDFANELTETFVLCQALRYRIDIHISPSREQTCRLLKLCGYTPLLASNAAAKQTWKSTGIPNLYMLRPFQVYHKDSNEARALSGDLGQSDIVRSGMVCRNNSYFYSLDCKEEMRSVSRFSSCVMVDLSDVVKRPNALSIGVVEAYFLHSATGTVFFQVLCPRQPLQHTSVAFARAAPATLNLDHYSRILLPIKNLIRPMWWIHCHGSGSAWVMEYVHHKTMDDSIPLRHFNVTRQEITYYTEMM
eukprot:TRINITY_DN1560_c0_g1_i3.p1 TRINITY_DN1560_c0_g1~~TRINITY_DN1560_c0_g1_i3.p1  ORF type:complete len:617 (+),score=48.87 TRINITY_DN1560_c0_g1_i3:996-2846(+)